MKRLLCSVLTGAFLVMTVGSCEEDTLTIGEDVIGGEPFGTGKAVYDVFAYNRQISAVPTNRLPIYQLGVFEDPVYGRTEARITAQLNLRDGAGNPTFGIYSQNTEDSNPDVGQENETVTEVRLYLPFFLDGAADSDRDGVIDSLEPGDDAQDPTNDSDGDGIPNNQETSAGTNPLDPDTDGDGTPDNQDTDTQTNVYPITRELDSIYGDRTQPFTLKVERSTYFLSDLDPEAGFETAPPNYSNLAISPGFVSEVLFEDQVTINNQQVLFFEEDDPDTEVDESATVAERLSPGIIVYLDTDFFQQNFLDMEGQPELLSNTNFREFLRGIHLSLTPAAENEMLILLDLANARLRISYEYEDVGDGDIVESTYEMRLLTGGGLQAIASNAVNTLVSDAYPTEVQDAVASDEHDGRIYLKGGAGLYAELDLFEQMGAENIINQIKQNNWIINAAYLQFYVDRTLLDGVGGTAEPPRLYVYNAETNRPLYNRLTETIITDNASGVYLNYDGFLESSGGSGVKYSVNITEHLNNIIVRDSSNARLGITLTPDLRLTGVNDMIVPGGGSLELPVSNTITPLGTVLIGSNTGDPNRLRLELHYTEIDP